MKRIIAVVATALFGFGFAAPAFAIATSIPPASQQKAFHCGSYFHGHTVRSYEWRDREVAWRVTSTYPTVEQIRLSNAPVYNCQRNA